MSRTQISIKGRGAADNPEGRFDKLSRDREADADTPRRPETVVTLQQARSILTRNESPDIPFSQSINPYQGCEHGCIYCYARPTHAYPRLPPGLDFETRLFADLLRNRFQLACNRLGLNSGKRNRLDTGKFRRPGPQQAGLS